MPDRPRPRLRRRLFTLLLAFAAVPSLVLALLAHRTLDASLELWRSPSVSRALEGSLGVARELLGSRRPALESALERLVQGLPASAAPSVASLETGPFDAIGFAPQAGAAKLTWVYRKGADRLGSVLERRLSALPQDTLVAAGSGRLALLHRSHGRRWIALSPLPPVVDQQLRDILEAQAFYDQLEDYRAVARRSLVVVTVVLLALLLALSWLAASMLAPRLTRPLEALARAMETLSRGGTPGPIEAGDDEVGQLAHSFEAMSRDLEVSRRELARAERVAAWREVARRIAHEIKNPLTPIRLAVHRLRGLEDSLPADEKDRLHASLDSVDREVETLRNMADTFSRFSRLPEPERRPADVATLVRSVSEMYAGGGLRLECDVPDDLRAALDEGQVRQALHNLIQNAAHATDGAGPVQLTAAAETRDGREGVRFEVCDAGPGFGREALAHAGEPYFTEKTHGTGLGLAMVRRIAEGHGGAFRLYNREPRGACVELWIPEERDA